MRRVLHIVMVTAECNLACSYCGGSLVTMPRDITYDLDDLTDFIKNDGDDETVVALYGGEPLLRPAVVRHLLDVLPAHHFVLQTNGFFMERLGDAVHDFGAILLSIDGRPQVTDAYRGEGCHDQVMDARRWLNDTGYQGDLIARMAASKHTDIYNDVMYLLRFFPHVHWQLDAVWSPLWDLPEFRRWAERSYLPGVERLIETWAEHLKQGDVLGIVPFLGVTKRLIWGGSGLPCGAGQDAVTITTDGRVIACPIAAEFGWNTMGDLSGVHDISISEPCISCDIYDVCGGRCLFAYKEWLWGDEGFETLCHIARHLVEHLEAIIPVVKEQLPSLKSELFYPPFNNTTEIIP